MSSWAGRLRAALEESLGLPAGGLDSRKAGRVSVVKHDNHTRHAVHKSFTAGGAAGDISR